MRTCQTCSREQPDARDFCQCGEYLRWELTGAIRAVAPAPSAPAPPPAVAGAASITLRLPDRAAEHGELLGVGVEPGQRERVLALVRNQSGIVDNYELRIEGVPEGWWSIFPDTVYLVPFGSAGTYEQEVEIHLHPPRTPDAEARLWELEVVALSKANGRDAASEPLALGILPYTETATKVRPERAKGRRKAQYTVDVSNRANAPVVVALEGSDPDGELAFGFDRPPAQITPGQTVQTTMRVKPPKQVWLGRVVEKRFEVNTLTGEAAAERLAAEPESAPAGPPPAARRGRLRIPGISKPQVFRPQVREPGVTIGPGGIDFRAPQLRGPQLRGPQMRSKNVQLSNLKNLGGGLGGGGAAAGAPAMPLMPSQGVFRQKPWLPWWLVPVVAALAAVAVLLFMVMPKNVTVPDVVGAASAFDAQKRLVHAGLAVAPVAQEKVTDASPPGTVLDQTPAAGENAERDSEVTLRVAIGTGTTTVPTVVGRTAVDAEQVLRNERLSLGQASVQPVDPAKKISSQIPAADEVVKDGTPVDIFYPEPGKGDDGGGAADGGGSGGGGGGGDVTIPPIDRAEARTYAQRIADLGLTPKKVIHFDDAARGTVFRTMPAAGESVALRSTVRLLVSAGQPLVAFDNDKDIGVVDASGHASRLFATSSAEDKRDPTWSPDGERLGFIGDDRVYIGRVETGQSVAVSERRDVFRDLAWAPTTDRDVLAMVRVEAGATTLCLGRLKGRRLAPRCLPETGLELGSIVHWTPEGRSLLVFGQRLDGTGGGIVQYTTRRPFSSDPDDWSGGDIVTDDRRPERMAIDATVSPDGQSMIVVANLLAPFYELFVTQPGDFALDEAERLGVRGCKVAWQADAKAAVAVNGTCGTDAAAELVRFSLNDPSQRRALALYGDNPAYRPILSGK